MNVKTYSAKPTDVTRTWYVVDASETPLGRLSTQVASLLMGKHKPMFTQHVDCGDYVVVINADKLIVTGNKLAGKTYYRHTGHPGGIKETTLQDKDPRQVIEAAIRGMMPANKLRPGRLARLKVYAEDQHNHQAQQPVAYSLKEGK